MLFMLSNFMSSRFKFRVVMSLSIDFRVKTKFASTLYYSICFVGGWCYIYVICIYLHILVSNTISISDVVHVFDQ